MQRQKMRRDLKLHLLQAKHHHFLNWLMNPEAFLHYCFVSSLKKSKQNTGLRYSPVFLPPNRFQKHRAPSADLHPAPVQAAWDLRTSSLARASGIFSFEVWRQNVRLVLGGFCWVCSYLLAGVAVLLGCCWCIFDVFFGFVGFRLGMSFWCLFGRCCLVLGEHSTAGFSFLLTFGLFVSCFEHVDCLWWWL